MNEISTCQNCQRQTNELCQDCKKCLDCCHCHDQNEGGLLDEIMNFFDN
ncbi:MAG: hypothetical protein NZ822_01500 [Patescibacteria group bacterium]|nr:hypothetical protein [Patescibacteria group bacterium]